MYLTACMRECMCRLHACNCAAVCHMSVAYLRDVLKAVTGLMMEWREQAQQETVYMCIYFRVCELTDSMGAIEG